MPGVLAAGHAHEGDAVAVVGVHVGCTLNTTPEKLSSSGWMIFSSRLRLTSGVGHARAGRGRHIDHRVQHFHHPEVVHPGAEERG